MSGCVQSSDSSATVRVSLLINLVSAAQRWCTRGLNWDFGDTANTFCIFPSLPQCLLCFLKPTLYSWGVKAPHFILLIIHTHTHEYYSAIKNNEILPSATTWMDLEGIMLSDISQIESQIPYDFTYLWNLKKQNKWTNITKQEQSHRYREQTDDCQRGGGEEDEWNRWGD